MYKMTKVIKFESVKQRDGLYTLVTPCPYKDNVKVYSITCQLCEHYTSVFSSTNTIKCNADKAYSVNKNNKKRTKKGGTL